MGKLEEMRRRYKDGVQAIQETARKLTIIGRLMEVAPDRLATSSDRYSTEYWLEDGEHGYVSSRELEGLERLIVSTRSLGHEISIFEEEGVRDERLRDVVSRSDN